MSLQHTKNQTNTQKQIRNSAQLRLLTTKEPKSIDVNTILSIIRYALYARWCDNCPNALFTGSVACEAVTIPIST